MSRLRFWIVVGLDDGAWLHPECERDLVARGLIRESADGKFLLRSGALLSVA